MPPRWREVQEFCHRQGYRETRTDHYHYLKVLPDGSTSGTMASFGEEGQVIRPALWQDVWRRQLRLASEEEFWSGLKDLPVHYNIPPAPPPPLPPPRPLPRYLVDFLRGLGLSDDEIAGVMLDDALQRWNAYWIEQAQDNPP